MTSTTHAFARTSAQADVSAGGLWNLISGNADPLTPSAMLAFGFATLFGAIYAGSAIMLIPYGQ